MTIDGVSPAWIRARASAERLQRVAIGDPSVKARIIDVTPGEYLGDPCRTPSLSASVAHMLTAESALYARAYHPRLGGQRSAPTERKTDGSLMHTLMLGKGREITVVPHHDFRTNAAKDLRDAAFAEGKVPVLEHVFAEKAALAIKLREKCRELGYSLDGESEVAIEWKEDCEGEQVLCRSMLDHVIFARGAIYDLKTVESANPRRLARVFRDYGYDIEHTAHSRALERLRPELAGRVTFTFLFCEIEPPYDVVPVRPAGQFREIGMLRWEAAVRRWRDCLASDDWPGHCPNGNVVMLEPPPWVVTEELGTWQA